MFVNRQTKFLMMLLLVFALFASGLQAVPASAATQGRQGTISVIGENGTPLLAETPVKFTDNESAFNVLVNQVGTSNVNYTQYSFGKMINSIDHLAGTADYKKYWGFYINGISSQTGADSYIVQNGDYLSFRYIDTSQPSTTVSLKITANNNTVLDDFSGSKRIGIAGSPTALQLLQVTLGPSKVGLKDTQYGPMIMSIDDTAAQGNSYWAFYINGKMATVGANSYHLQPNDQISFQYETYVPSNGGGNNGTTSKKPDTLSADRLQKAIDSASRYTLKNGINDWGAIALKKAGKTIPSSYIKSVEQDIQNKRGKFHYITDAEKYTLGILAAGGNPTNISGFNLVKSVYNGDVTKQGINGVAFALIALDSANFTIPTNAVWTKEKLVKELLAQQQKDGGWSLYTTAKTSDPDITAMVLTALAPYKNEAEVKDKVGKAVQFLSAQYLDSKIDNSSTAAQVVIALSALGIDANSSAVTKGNVSLLEDLLSYQHSDGGFSWHLGDKSDTFSTPEGFQALVAYQLYVNGKGSLYHFPLAASTNLTSIKNVQSIRNQTQDKSKLTKAQAGQTQNETSNRNGTGHPLPNTATNAENLVLLGILFITAGLVFYYFNKRKEA